MIDVLLAIAITGAVFVVVGAPFALSIRTAGSGWLTLASDALGFGLVAVPLAIVLWSLYGPLGIALVVVIIAVFAFLAVRAKVGLPSRPARAPISLIITWIVVIVVAIALRHHDATFLPWVGDMGAYVNWSNEFVRTGELSPSWPPVYSAFLSLSTALFGSAGTTSGIAITGLTLIAVVTRLLYLLKLNRWVIVGIAAAITFNLHAVWYSTFPSSESLNAPVFIIWATMLVVTIRASRAQLPAAVGLTFLVMLHLCLLRGSGSFLLAPALLLAVTAIALPAWRQWAPRAWAFFIASLIAAEVGVWYGVTYIPRYFVDMQLRMLAPAKLFAWGKEIGLFAPGILLFAVLVVMTGAAFLGLRYAVRHRDGDITKGVRATAILAWVAGGALIVVLALEGIVGANVWFIFVRTGLWLVIVAAVALFVIARRRVVTEEVLVVFLLTASALLLTAFHTRRLGNDRIHAFFMYWDRYLFSEIIPALFVVAAVGANAIVLWLAANGRLAPLATMRWVPVATTAVVVAAIVVPHAPAIARMSEDSYMDGAYPFTLRLASAVSTEEYVLWGATSPDAAPGFFFPNTWMAFAVPLERTFGHEFPNVDQGNDNFQPDDVITTAQIDRGLEKSDSVYVYETQTGKGQPLDERLPDGYTATQQSSTTSDIALLAQERQLAEWTHAEITVVVWEVTRTP